MISFAETARSLLKNISLKTRIYDRLFFTVYPYLYEPKQLLFLTECIKSVVDVPGCFVEAGCARGATSVFLNKFMDGEGIRRDYYAIDTFSGFVNQDLEHEIVNRGKPSNIAHHFTENKKSWFDRSMALHGIERLKSIEIDVTKFDFSAIAPIAFCLVDVDLYKPIRDILPKIYMTLSPGGILVVDDCKPQGLWDGALQAYEEFVQERTIPRCIVADKLGIIKA